MKRLAITTGEPAGIGPEISLQSAQLFLDTNPDVCIHLIGDASFFKGVSHPRLVIDHLPLASPVTPGLLDVANAPYVLATLDWALKGSQAGAYDAIVTAPVQKSVIKESGIDFLGHTEYFAQACGVPLVVMMLCGTPIFKTDLLPKQIRVALATTHIPINQVPQAINEDLLVRTIDIIHEDLRGKFGIKNPVIYVTGLNPHAGESGHMGQEEIRLIEPAIATAKAKGYLVEGPLAGDTIFSPKNLKSCDAILAMYHDQGLAPFKFATFGSGVNVTLGLPIIRTSVDHGTALGIAGKGIADCSSMMAALELALQLAEKHGSSSA
jgi:4-hydroxythreonine-4-phosphate dehydrogenase